jgi:hypothetical protein
MKDLVINVQPQINAEAPAIPDPESFAPLENADEKTISARLCVFV